MSPEHRGSTFPASISRAAPDAAMALSSLCESPANIGRVPGMPGTSRGFVWSFLDVMPTESTYASRRTRSMPPTTRLAAV
jgi:hypothetical protein